MTNREWSADLTAIGYSAADSVQHVRVVSAAVERLVASKPGAPVGVRDLEDAARILREAVDLVQLAAEKVLNHVADDAVDFAVAEGVFGSTSEHALADLAGRVIVSDETVARMDEAIARREKGARS